MDEDISRLEELLAVDSSDDDQVREKSLPAIPVKSPQATEFLSEVLLNENKILSLSKSKRKFMKSKLPQTDEINSTKDSLVHTGDTDSSDDEDKRNYLEKKYNDYGTEIKKIISSKEIVNGSSIYDNREKSHKINSEIVTSKPTSKAMTNGDVYADPIFGLRIINPLISNAAMNERMQGREAVSMFKVKRHTAHGDLNKDWVIAGVIVRKSGSKESQKGSQFCIWTVSDLKDDLKTVALFLFRGAYKQLWKTPEGTVIGILNPNVLDKRDDSKDEACLSVDNPDRVMIMGKSKDFGYCKSVKKNGEQCTSFVNLFQCKYCVYHVKQEYQKCSMRADLQGSISNKGIHDLRNKVLGKDTYIYGGKSFSAIPTSKNKKMSAKDNNRLQSLDDYFKSAEQDKLMINKSPNVPLISKKKMATQIDVNRSQRAKDLERIKMLQGSVPEVVLKEMNSPKSSPSQSKLTLNPSTSVNSSPSGLKLGIALQKAPVIDLNLSYSARQSTTSKSNALKWIKENGPLKKNNPHNIRGSVEGKKRLLQRTKSSENIEPSEKKIKSEIFSDKFKKMLQASSAHADLVTQRDDEEQDKYFNKLEIKEAMEEKMLNTFKVACKGVRCLKCSYTNFSASEKCKQEKHPLKVFDTFKRFFKCTNCNNRTVSLDVIPLHSCKNCHMSKWQRAAMINERKCVTLADTLSIRGGEEKFIGSCVQTGANINLLVPDD